MVTAPALTPDEKIAQMNKKKEQLEAKRIEEKKVTLITLPFYSFMPEK